MRTAEEAIGRLRDPASRVSAHYVVEEDGAVWRLVPEERRAWHAGVSHWRGQEALNGRSIGIEVVNPGHEWGYRPFPALQMAAVCDLCLDIIARHRDRGARRGGAQRRRRPTASRTRASCSTGKGWRRTASGCGRVARVGGGGTGGPPTPRLRCGSSARIGYRTDLPLPTLLAAFQRRWRPERVDGALDARHTRPPRRSGRVCTMGTHRERLTRRTPRAHSAAAPGGRTAAGPGSAPGLEESPGSTGTTVPANGRRGRPQGKCHRKQTARPRKAPGKGERVRQERTAPPATGAARQTPPGARPNRGGRRSRLRDIIPATGGRRGVPAPPPGLAARGAPRGASQRNGRPIPVIHGGGQNPAYRPPGALFPTACPQAFPGDRLRTAATTKIGIRTASEYRSRGCTCS